MTPSTIEQALSLARRMRADPSAAVALAPQLADLIDRLPPPAGELLSRPLFERATLYTEVVSFENVPPGAQPPPQSIRCQRDLWFRGVTAQAYPSLTAASAEALFAKNLILKQFSKTTNGRNFFEVNWKLEGTQGFISRGAEAEILAPAVTVTSDGFFHAPLDWQLQANDTIQVRIRNAMRDLFPATISSEIFSDAELTLRWVVVTFWAEEPRTQPSVRR